MKLLDEIKVVNDNYKDNGITQGMIGTIIEADIRWNSFYVCFQDQRVYNKEFMKIQDNILKLQKDICLGIKISDMEVVRESNVDNNEIYNNLPENHKDCWCKVENGFIVNLKDEKKNSIPYCYNS